MEEADLPSPESYSSFTPFIKGVFSQWHATDLTLNGERYCTAEQWMMVSKARLFDDHIAAALILETDDPAKQKRLGQTVQNFQSSVWDKAKLGIVFAGNYAKFSQNKGAARQLLSTAPAMLVEANPRDWIWGVGLAIDDPQVGDPSCWRGSNLLGRILTKVRSELERH
ncbi:MAG: DUF1768 domain-containing protein [Alphaproteobacteria bacterium]|nr:MAG: DUF1768 domain-containing protein [Alphaproteobacteria bacterium]